MINVNPVSMDRNANLVNAHQPTQATTLPTLALSLALPTNLCANVEKDTLDSGVRNALMVTMATQQKKEEVVNHVRVVEISTSG